MSIDGNRLLPSRYKVIEELGRGGMSIVYRAVDTEHDREVAVKILKEDCPSTERFRREARKLASLSHPNVVSFLEVGECDGRDYLVMEYVGGGDLRAYLTTTPSLPALLETFSLVCAGLDHLHRRGIVHRDLKPENILVDAAGTPKLADLGVAREMERNTKLTEAGSILGTYQYVAPEQILSSDVTPSADLYSLGICLFEAVTGRLPFTAGSEYETLHAHVQKAPPKANDFNPDLPEGVVKLIDELLRKDPEQRPNSAVALGETLRALAESFHPPKIGRERELDELEQYLLNSPNRVLLSAGTGLGRSWMVAQLARRLTTARVLSPLAGVAATVEHWGQILELDPERLSQQTFGDLTAHLPHPCVVLVDDAERLPDELLERVLGWLDQPVPEGTALLLSLSSTRAARLGELEGVEEVCLGQLDDEFFQAQEVTGLLRSWLVTRAAGSLRLFRQNLTALKGAGCLGPKPVPPPVHPIEAAWTYIQSQNDEFKSVLRTAVLAPCPFTFDLMVSACGLSEEKADEILEQLTALGAVENSEFHGVERFRLVWDELGERFKAELSPRLARRTMMRLADSLKELGEDAAALGALREKTEQYSEAAAAYRQAHRRLQELGFGRAAENIDQRLEELAARHPSGEWKSGEQPQPQPEPPAPETPVPDPEPEPEPERVLPPEPVVAPAPSLETEAAPAPPRVVETREPVPVAGEHRPHSRASLMAVIFFILAGLAVTAFFFPGARKTQLTISCGSVKANITIDGEPRGVAPLEVKLMPGEHKLQAELEGYDPVEQTIKLEGEKTRELTLEMTRLTGEIELAVQPEGTELLVDGDSLGQTPKSILLAPGEHNLIVRKKGFAEFAAPVVVEPHQKARVEATLKPLVTTLSVTTQPAGATVTVNGKESGKTPVKLFKLPHGDYEVKIALDGYEPVTKSYQLEKPEELELTLEARPSTLKITSNPSGATVKINGAVKGETPCEVTGLAAKQYTLGLTKSGWLAHSEKVELGPGETVNKSIQLDRYVPPPPPAPVYRPPPEPVYRPAPAPAPWRPAPAPAPAPSNPWSVK